MSRIVNRVWSTRERGPVRHRTTIDNRADGGGPALYATGTFTADVNGVPYARFAKWDGVAWTEVGGGTDATPGPMFVLPAIGLAVGGSFPNVGDADVPGSGATNALAYWARDCE